MINPILLASIIVFSPFFALLSILLISAFTHIKGTVLALSSLAISFFSAMMLMVQCWGNASMQQSFTWFTIGSFALQGSILLDSISLVMVLLVTFISLMVGVYSTQYMQGEPLLHRYWAYLSLFVFAMLGLLLASSLLFIYIFWELIGLASFLLIGFWFTKENAVKASRKAFIINRIGDMAFLIALLLVFYNFGTFNLPILLGSENILGLLAAHPETTSTLIGFCLLIAALAKSAQFPLHTWLPDAMEGPTSASALIHAATLVAAGIYLLIRTFPLFSPLVLDVMAALGCFTALMAASIALAQHDIKKILAFSTVSQLGFMLAAIGVGHPKAALFHLITHAFFKCILFLGTGAILQSLQQVKNQHQLNFNTQDIRLMGGVYPRMKFVFLSMLLATFAIVGAPFFSGYLSKELILLAVWRDALAQGAWKFLLLFSLLLAVICTAMYMVRLVFEVFLGRFRLQDKYPDKTFQINSLGKAITIPLGILSVFTLFIPYSTHPFYLQYSWLDSVNLPSLSGLPVQAGIILPCVTVFAIFAGIVWSYHQYRESVKVVASPSKLQHFFLDALHLDTLYNQLFVKSMLISAQALFWFESKILGTFVRLCTKVMRAFAGLAALIDKLGIDAFVNGVGSMAFRLGKFINRQQKAQLQAYLAASIGSLLFILLIYLISSR